MTATSAPSAYNANPFPAVPASRGPDTVPLSARPGGLTPRSYPSRRFGDYSRTRFESRVAFGGPDEDTERITESRRKDMSEQAT